MIARARVGLELAPNVIRGVRVGDSGATRTFVLPVAAGGERAALAKAVRALGRDASIRLVVRGMRMAGSKLIPQPLQEIGAFTEHLPLAARESAWEAIPLLHERTLLLGVSRSELEARLDEWGLTPTAALSPRAVGLTAAALLALESDLTERGDWSWIDGDRSLHFHVDGRRVRTITLLEQGARPMTVLGPGAKAYQASHAGVEVYRPAGLEPDFAVAWGATVWGTAAWPGVPNLEPKDRRDYRTRALAAARTSKRAQAAALTCLVLAGGVHFYGLRVQAGAETVSGDLGARKADLERNLASVCEAVAARLPSGPRAESDILEALQSLVPLQGRILLDACQWKASGGGAYAGLSAATERGLLTLKGRASTLDAVEAMRAALQSAGRVVDVQEAASTERPEYPVDFRMTVQ